MTARLLTLEVNGTTHHIAARDHATLLEVLREDLGLTGTKHGCELGECGACTVLVDGAPWLSCLTVAREAEGRRVTTIEGLAKGPEPHPLQVAFADLGAAQCGYCTPGVLMSASSLLETDPVPTTQQIKEALAGNLCRCTGYIKIIEAVHLAAERAGAASGPGTGGAS